MRPENIPGDPMTDRKRTKAQERAMSDMLHDLGELERDMELMKKTTRLVPATWGDVGRNAKCTAKKKVMTIRLDPEVLDWFRALGTGYQNRINLVLRAYMKSVISKHIEESRDRDWMDEPI